jgi:hypothetical protein
MKQRIQIGDNYFDLTAGAPGRPGQISTEKADTPDALDPVAFASTKPDPIAQYIARPAEPTEKPPEAELDQLTAWQAFTGPKSVYPQQWQNYTDGRQKHCGFNIWAFLFGLQWFAFRKMYGKALIAGMLEMAIVIALMGQGRSLPGLWLTLVISLSLPRLAIGYWANFALFRKAQREIAKVRSFNTDNSRKLAMIAAAGSGSFVSLMLLYGVLFAIRFLSTKM